MTLRTMGIASLAAHLAACSGVPVPPVAQTAPPAPTKATATPPPPLSPVHWTWSVRGPDAASNAVRMGGAIHALLAGRRVRFAEDGSARTEVASSTPPLQELLVVPGAGGGRLFGATRRATGESTLFRFDDPLGEGRLFLELGADCAYAGLPGTLAVRCADGEHFIDPETGGARPPMKGPAGAPLLLSIRRPIGSAAGVVFTSPLEGAALFPAMGLQVTGDGGATWRPVAGAPECYLGLRGGPDGVSLVNCRSDQNFHVDIAGTRLAPIAPAPDGVAGSFDATPIARPAWATHDLDPLGLAATVGAGAPDGGALLAIGGEVLRVDLRTGDITAVGALPATMYSSNQPAPGPSICSVVNAGQDTWIGCPESEMLVPVAVAGRTVRLGEPVRAGRGGTLRASPSGGVLVVRGNGKDASAVDVAVRQPDRSFETHTLEAPAAVVGPLADGRFAIVRPGSEPGWLQVVMVQPSSGAETGLPPFEARGQWQVQSPIEEGTDHVLRVALTDADGPMIVAQPIAGGGARISRIPGATVVRMRAGRALAIGEGRLSASLDGGATWTEATAPLRLAGPLEVSEVGARIGDALRLGWEEPEAAREPATANAPPIATMDTAPPPTGKLHRLACQDAGPSASLAVPADDDVAAAMLGVKPAPAGVTRHLSLLTTGSAIVALVEDGSAATMRTRTWSLRWLDRDEIGSHVRSWSGAPPRIQWVSAMLTTSEVDEGAVKGDRALIGMSVYDEERIARGDDSAMPVRLQLGAGGRVEVLPMSPAPGGAFLGEGKDEPTAWLSADTNGSQQQTGFHHVFARLGGRWQRTTIVESIFEDAPSLNASISIGVPTKDGVPILVSTFDWDALRIVPFEDVAGAGKKRNLSFAHAFINPLFARDGWTPIAGMADLERLPVCDPGISGARFDFVVPHTGGATLDATTDLTTKQANMDVRVANGAACVAGVSRIVGDSYVRADLLGKRAEGGRLQLTSTQEKMRKLTCQWVESP